MQPVAQQQTALQKLQEEKEQLRKRQEELNRQVKLEQVHFVCTHSIIYN
jgi:multidrug resistance efflux pump